MKPFFPGQVLQSLHNLINLNKVFCFALPRISDKTILFSHNKVIIVVNKTKIVIQCSNCRNFNDIRFLVSPWHRRNAIYQFSDAKLPIFEISRLVCLQAKLTKIHVTLLKKILKRVTYHKYQTTVDMCQCVSQKHML